MVDRVVLPITTKERGKDLDGQRRQKNTRTTQENFSGSTKKRVFYRYSRTTINRFKNGIFSVKAWQGLKVFLIGIVACCIVFYRIFDMKKWELLFCFSKL